MAQVFDPVPSDHPSRILCCYTNATSKIQIVRITNIVNWYFERVVFPGQRLIFEALVSAQLEVHSGAMASAILSDTIPCQRLRVSSGKEEQDSVSDQAESTSIPSGSDQPSAFQRNLSAPHAHYCQPV
ncbi:MAG: DUF1830 domain-containing protein [Elainellaceae cyanobacterium]